MHSDFPLRLTAARRSVFAALCLVLSASGFPGNLMAQAGRTVAPPAVLGPAPGAPPAITLPAVQSYSQAAASTHARSFRSATASMCSGHPKP